MKRNSLYLLLLLFLFAIYLFSCSQDQAKEGKTLVKINGYNLTLAEYQDQLAAEVELDADFKLTNAAKKEFLERLVRKELLIQEAQKLELDRKEKFVRAIERYWESTLIRDLMEMKGEQIGKRILISQEEIENCYNVMKKSDDKCPSLSEMRGKIIEHLEEKKRIDMLKKWSDELREKARIEINRDLLYAN